MNSTLDKSAVVTAAFHAVQHGTSERLITDLRAPLLRDNSYHYVYKDK